MSSLSLAENHSTKHFTNESSQSIINYFAKTFHPSLPNLAQTIPTVTDVPFFRPSKLMVILPHPHSPKSTRSGVPFSPEYLSLEVHFHHTHSNTTPKRRASFARETCVASGWHLKTEASNGSCMDFLAWLACQSSQCAGGVIINCISFSASAGSPLPPVSTTAGGAPKVCLVRCNNYLFGVLSRLSTRVNAFGRQKRETKTT